VSHETSPTKIENKEESMPSNLSASTSCGYGDVRTVKISFDDAVVRIEGALKTEGFGVLCQIDIQAKLKEKLGVDSPRYVILGACNPPLAQQALQQDINLGLLLPCNVVVYEEGGQVHVGVVDAVRMLSVANHPEMEGLARQVNEKLRRALDSVAPRPAFT
jgi:uncharacterized protein (DUF302 family)